MRTALPVIVLLAGIGIVQVLVAAKPAPEKKEEAQRLVSLYVDEVASDQVTVTVETQGEVRPKTEIDLVPQVSGRVVMLSDRFAEGAKFDPDTVLIRIDDSDYRLELVQAEARVAAAHTSLEEELATAKIKEAQWRTKGGNAEPTPFALNVPQVAEARARLRSAEAELEEARLNLARTEIRVPFHGRVRSKNIGLGQFVSSGTSLGRVFSVDTVEVRLPLTDTQLMELNLPMGYSADQGQGPLVNFKATVGNESHFWQGRIRRVNAAVDQETRLIYATAEVEDPYGKAAVTGMPMAVGLFVSAEIAGVDQRPVFVMPRKALRNEDKVYVVNGDSKLEIRTVEVLSTSEELVYVTSGVEPGEQVVTSTIPAAVDGMQVQAISANRPS
jgi:RND family efflux transporter MFP subunit